MGWKIFNLDNESGRINYDDIGENKTPLLEVEKEQKIGTNLKIKGKIYHVSMVSFKNYYIGVREINFVDPEDVEETIEDEFTCPYCNHVYGDAFELSDTGKVDCPRCGSNLEYEREVTVNYRVTPVKRAKIRTVK